MPPDPSSIPLSPVMNRWLNLFRTSEIYGAEVLLRMLPLAREAEVVLDLHRHICEEASHARLWTHLIVDLGGEIRHELGYQRYLQQTIPPMRSMAQLVALNIVTERRAARNYRIFHDLPGLDPRIRKTLTHLMREEEWHIEWQTAWLRGMKRHRLGMDAEQLLDLFRPHDVAAIRAIFDSIRDPAIPPAVVEDACQPV